MKKSKRSVGRPRTSSRVGVSLYLEAVTVKALQIMAEETNTTISDITQKALSDYFGD